MLTLQLEVAMLFPLCAFSAAIVFILNSLLNTRREIKKSIEEPTKLGRSLNRVRRLFIMNFVVGIIVLVDIFFVLLRILRPCSGLFVVPPLTLIFGLFMVAVVIMIVGYVISYRRYLSIKGGEWS